MPGLNAAFSSLSLTSNTRRKEEWMDPEMWGKLPEPIMETILSYLPLPYLLPMRTVCKKWNYLLQTSSFLSTQRHLTVQCSSYVLTYNEPAFSAFSFFQQGPELYYLRSSSLYCPVSKNWFNMSLDCLPIRDFYITSVGGGLLCFVAHNGPQAATHREVVLGVCNPATRTWRILPRWGGSKAYNMPHFVAMVVDNFRRSYKIILIDHDRLATRTYDSVRMVWTKSDDVPSRHNFPYYDRCPSQAVFRGNTLVCSTQCKTGISSYDMDTCVWESYHVSLPNMLSNVHLVQHHNRILMISRVMKAKYEGSDRVQISELDPEGLRVATTLSDVPLGPSKQFLDHFKVCEYNSVDDSEGLCFISVTTGERWLYDLEERFWHILPSSPGSKTKSMAAYGGFSVHLRVDVQP
ncbi:F-box/kelch-repeat protein At5g15710 [Physcomitrium patens]|uniref:F-box domain-containing protein n=1 Tax=Physcomitrium patens TaxID=3218 RepID=A0A2K1IY72_PHYPA|nr:F-box/kelch-repeat protein At5g15710-like [Physcomitrium patens]PNR34229.1 hypothetical protein PHYPA_024046 [Physcomitrium patens]|eukprot:XP_024403675.1 F-box/kelch-repeat protein At5g15710-like [Physcomitrella patens]